MHGTDRESEANGRLFSEQSVAMFFNVYFLFICKCCEMPSHQTIYLLSLSCSRCASSAQPTQLHSGNTAAKKAKDIHLVNFSMKCCAAAAGRNENGICRAVYFSVGFWCDNHLNSSFNLIKSGFRLNIWIWMCSDTQWLWLCACMLFVIFN